MDLRSYIEAGELLKDGRPGLAAYLHVTGNLLTDAKGGRKQLPSAACVLLAQLLNVPEIQVIAASELATEKDENKRAIWRPFVETLSILLVIVASLVTPPNAEASNGRSYSQMRFDRICIMLPRRLAAAIVAWMHTLAIGLRLAG